MALVTCNLERHVCPSRAHTCLHNSTYGTSNLGKYAVLRRQPAPFRGSVPLVRLPFPMFCTVPCRACLVHILQPLFVFIREGLTRQKTAITHIMHTQRFQ
jgi:hypothetical protein